MGQSDANGTSVMEDSNHGNQADLQQSALWINETGGG